MAQHFVFIEENDHEGEPGARRQVGEFPDCTSAQAYCESRVDEQLKEIHKIGMSVESLYGSFTTYGESPYIICNPNCCEFSAFDYARKRSKEMCKDKDPGTGNDAE